MNRAPRCTVEDDGYHLHEFYNGPTTVTEHRHTWVDEHIRRWPDASRVYVGNRPHRGTVAEAWRDLTGRNLPPINCQQR